MLSKPLQEHTLDFVSGKITSTEQCELFKVWTVYQND